MSIRKRKADDVNNNVSDEQPKRITPPVVKSAKKSSEKMKKQSSGSKSAKKKTESKTSNKETDKGKERYFKLIDAKTKKPYGRYTGDTPKQAASKGFTKILQKLKGEGKNPPKQSTIYLRESTRGSAKKYYGYEASRLKLEEPQQLVITNKENGETKTITYNFRNRIKKVPVPDEISGPKKNRSTKKLTGSKGPKKESSKSAKSKSASKKSSKALSKSKKGSGGKNTSVKKTVDA
jgi:hypothetical protein